MGYGVGVDGGWGLFWNIIYNYLNIPLCLLKQVWCLFQTSWEWFVLLFKGERVGDLRRHHGTTLGLPRAHRRHSSTHTWAPWHVWRAPCGRNSMGLGAAYLFPMLARGRLSLVQWASWRSHGCNAMVWWSTRRVADSDPWCQCMTQGRNALCSRKKQPWVQFHDSLLWSLDLTEGARHMPRPWAP